VDDAALGGELRELGRLLGVERERLLADDVLAGRERLLDLCVVQVVRRREVNDIHIVVGEQLLVAPAHRREALRRRSLWGGSDDTDDVDSQPTQRLHVHGADEPGAHDAGAEVRKRPRHVTSSTVIAILVVRSSSGSRNGSVPSARSCARPSTEQFAGSSPSA
jgi:hypothetical protein